MNHAVFISYSSKKLAEATRVYEHLKKNNISCWISSINIHPGADYGEEIEKAIKECKIFFLLYNEDSAKSRHVNNELCIASEEGKFIIPCRIDDYDLQGGMRYRLAQSHWIDASMGIEAKLKELSDAVLKFLPSTKRVESTDHSSSAKASINVPSQSVVSASKESYKFYGYIAYAKADEKWASWLHKKLSNFFSPSGVNINKDLSTIIPSSICKDDLDLNIEQFEEGMRSILDAQYFIVICSPTSAKSQWLASEINAFIEMGRSNNIILFIVDGEPYSGNAETECIHPAIREQLPKMIGVDVRDEERYSFPWRKGERAFRQILSRMLQVSPQDIWRR